MPRRRLTRRVGRPAAVGIAIVALAGAAGAALAVATAGDVTVNLNEGDTSVAVGLTGTTDTGAGSVSYAVTGEPTHGTIDEGTGATGAMPCSGTDCTATIHYTPAADYFGDDSFTYKVTDTDGDSVPEGTVTIHVAAVNDPPTFSTNGDVEVNEDSGGYSAAWATSIDPGPNEGTQTVSFGVTGNDNATLFSSEPAVASDGTLTFTPAPDAFGVAHMTVTAQDDGGTGNGGNDTSNGASLTITVDNVNDPPTFSNAGGVTVLEDSGAHSGTWASSIDPGPNEGGQTVSFTVTGNDNTTLFSSQPAMAADGALTFTPAGNAFGVAHMTVTAQDDGGTSGGGNDTSSAASLTITVTGVNDPPSFSNAGAVTVLEDSGAHSGAWASSISAGPGEGTQTVTFTVTSNDNAALFSAAPAVASNGTLTFTPAANANGVAHMTVTAHDNGGTANGGNPNSSGVSLTITVTAVNDAPSFTSGPDEIVNHDSGAFTAASWATNISRGPANESTQTLSFSFTADDNPTLFSAGPAVSSTGTLTFTPAAGRAGTAHLTLVLKDSGGTTNGGHDTSAGAAVVIRINANPNAVNDNATVAENAAATVINVLGNDTSLPDPPETLTVTAVSNDTVNGPLHGTAAVSVGGGSVTYRPTPGYYGSDFFRYTIADPYGGTDAATVFVTITKDTTPPVVSSVAPRLRRLGQLSQASLAGVVTWTGSDAGVGISTFQIQRQINAGSWTSLTSSTITATSFNVSYLVGSDTYRFRVRGIDKNGNTSAWVYSATVHDAKYQETSSLITYGGTWALTSNTNDFGGAAKYTTIANHWAQITRSFRDIAVVLPQIPGRGSFKVYVDGVLQPGTISESSTTTRYRVILWTIHFGSAATHTIRITTTANVRIDLDAFVTLY